MEEIGQMIAGSIIAFSLIMWILIGFFHAIAYHLMLRLFQVKHVGFKRSMMEYTVYWLCLTAVVLMLVFGIIGLDQFAQNPNISFAVQIVGLLGILGVPILFFTAPVFINKSYKNGYGESFLILLLTQSLGGALMGLLGGVILVTLMGSVRMSLDASSDITGDTAETLLEEVVEEEASGAFVR